MNFFQDSTGNFSFQRLQAALVQGIILIVWALTSYHKGDMVDIPSGVFTLSGISIASLGVGKINETIQAIKSPKE